MLTFSLRGNFADLMSRLDKLPIELGDKALFRAVNRMAERARTVSNREIRADFNLSAATVRDKLFVGKAKMGKDLVMSAKVESRTPRGTRAINLIHFAERKVTMAEARRRMKAKTHGIYVKVKKGGANTLLPGAFIGNQGRTLFIRESKGRLPIRPLQTIDVPQMFNTKRVRALVVNDIRQQFPAILKHEMAFALKQVGKA